MCMLLQYFDQTETKYQNLAHVDTQSLLPLVEARFNQSYTQESLLNGFHDASSFGWLAGTSEQLNCSRRAEHAIPRPSSIVCIG